MSTEERIFKDLTSMGQNVGVLCTLGDYGQPQAASMYFVFDTTLNIYFITREASRKFKNIKKNPRAAFVVSTEQPLQTVQMEGFVEEVTDPHELSEHFSKLVAAASEKTIVPPVSQLDEGRMVFMKLSPDWVRSGNFELLKEDDKLIETRL